MLSPLKLFNLHAFYSNKYGSPPFTKNDKSISLQHFDHTHSGNLFQATDYQDEDYWSASETLPGFANYRASLRSVVH